MIITLKGNGVLSAVWVPLHLPSRPVPAPLTVLPRAVRTRAPRIRLRLVGRRGCIAVHRKFIFLYRKGIP